MAKQIQIPNYKVIVPNSFWMKNADTEDMPEHVIRAYGEKKIQQIVYAVKITEPTETQILNLIQDKAKTYKPLTAMLNNDTDPLAYTLTILQESDIERIAKGEPQMLARLAGIASLIFRNPGSSYLWIHEILMTQDYMRQFEKKIAKQDRKTAYEDLFLVNGARTGRVKILLDNNALPEKENLEILLESEVIESRVLTVTPTFTLYKKAADLIKVFYSALQQKNALPLLQDNSKKLLYSAIEQMIVIIARELNAERLEEELIKGMKEISPDVFEIKPQLPEEPPQNPELN